MQPNKESGSRAYVPHGIKYGIIEACLHYGIHLLACIADVVCHERINTESCDHVLVKNVTGKTVVQCTTAPSLPSNTSAGNSGMLLLVLHHASGPSEGH
jgi:hypothetical protein